MTNRQVGVLPASQAALTDSSDAMLMQALTTEHFALQSARAATIMESNGRVALFLGTVSSSVVAMALVGQQSDFDEPFYAFALALLPALLFLGMATYVRVLQNGLEDLQYARAINHIRKRYLALHDEAPSLFLLSTDETELGAMQGVMSERWQALFTTAGMVAFVIGVIAGATSGVLAAGPLSLTTAAAAASGAAVGLSVVLVLLVHQKASWRRMASTFSGPE
jgi:hypothetical protein